jgi:hypothetical protein
MDAAPEAELESVRLISLDTGKPIVLSKGSTTLGRGALLGTF